MQIPVNKNVEKYQDDFFKGLTFHQTFFSILTIIAAVGGFLFFRFLVHLPNDICIYAAIPIAIPPAAIGFVKIQGMSPLDYFKAKWKVKNNPIFLFRPDILQEDIQEYYLRNNEKLPINAPMPKNKDLMLETAETIGGDF